MNAIVQTLNTAGRTFVDFAVPMLIQSSVLILILLAVDTILRQRVRAVFRYWIWMLVLVKLVLPPSLWSPVSVGTWFGDRLEISTAALLEHVSRSSSPRSEGETPSTPQGQDALATKASPFVTSTFPRAQREFIERPLPAPVIAPLTAAKPAEETDPIDQPPAVSLNWQGLVLLVWLAVVTALLLLLAQRMSFVQGLVAQADEAGGAMRRELDQCRRHLGLRQPVSLRLSPNAASPAVCGLLRPAILIPQSLASRLHGADLQAVFFHELAHVQRGDLWINVLQTLLQIVYFYSPLLWLANAAIRRIREKAVDETVLVAMGEEAPQYPQTLVNVAKLAFARRPALSLRLIGVVESKSALTSRIQHILNRPIPKTARLGLAGLAVIAIIAAVLLPMAAAQNTAGSVTTDTPRDADGDGLSDYDELHKYMTDPAKKDSDGDGTPDGDWNERREYTYSVRTVLRYLPPLDEKALNDDFQDGRVLKQTDEYIEVEVIHYPLATGYDAIPENRNGRQDNAQMREYLAPGATTNWDEPMRRDLIAALKADGIDIETLSDKQVVEQVSRWLLKRSRYLDKVFTTWYIHFPQGKPAVYPGFEDAFRHEFERDKNNYDWTLDQHFDHELLGKGMFYNKTHGSCTSTAVYLTTVLRALGIPTRMVFVAPAVDASNREQILMVKKTLTHNRVRETMLAGLRRSSRGFTNHTLNEVYVGGRWRRLDYDQLGRPAFGVDRFGLQTHLYTVNDLSDVDLAATWGVRYAKGERNDLFQHDNPYSAVEVSELFGLHGQVPNPPFSAAELSSSPLPNLFLLSPRGVNVGSDLMARVENSTLNKTSRPHAKEYYDDLFEGVWTTKPGDMLVLLFSLDTPQRIPEGYEDLLPQPWPQIEAQLKQGQTVELSGKAREKNVILLASPTAGGLKPLVQNSKLLRAIGGRLGVEGVPPSERGQDARDTGAIGGASPAPGVDPAQPPAVSQSATKPVKLANGATVELLGVCEYPSEGRQWWRADGSKLNVAPYRTTNNKRELAEGFRDYEFVVQYGGAPDMDIEWSVPGSANTGTTGSPFDADGQSLRDLTVCTVRFPEAQTTADVRIGAAAGSWETPAVHRSLDREGTYSLSDGRAVAFGIAHFQDGRTLVPVTTNFFFRDIDFRVVAVDKQDKVCIGGLSGFGGDSLNSLTYNFNRSVSDIKELRLQTRPRTWVEFPTVALRPGLRTQVQAEPARAAAETMVSRRAPGQEKIAAIGPAWQILRDTVGQRYAGSISSYSVDATQRRQFFEKVLSWTRPGDAFVLMLAFDKPVGVPPEYADLLPLPWAQIESRIQKGESVEAQGQARDLTVIVLAAPTSEQLNTLVRRTHLLDSFRADASREIVLPEADGQRTVMLDLTTGELIPWPRAESPDRMGQAILKLGKGDLVYDCDLGDRSLILLRGATSEQAQDTGEPSIKGHLIGQRLPEVLTVKTAEGRQYQVTILAADDTACTLQYSLISTDRGAGGGALAGPETVGSGLELRIAPTREELGANVLQEWTKALAERRTPAGGRYLWVPVRPGTNLGPLVIAQTHEGKTWLLVHNAEPFIMVPAQGWRLAHVGRGIDDSGRPLVMLEFDDAGMERLRQLTRANDDKPLAEIVNGVVVAAPIFVKGQGGLSRAVIPGNFTEQEINDMMASLRRGTAEPFANTGGDFLPIRLRNGVIVELLGLCEHPSIGKRWWRPDGSLLTERPYDDDDGRAFPKPGEKGYKLAVRFSGLAGQDVGAYVIPSNSKTTNGGTLAQVSDKDGKKNAEYLDSSLDQEIVWQGVAFDEELDSFDLRVGVSRGPWKSEYRQEIGKSSEVVEWAVFKDVSLRPQRRTNTGTGAGGGARAGSEKGDTTRTEGMATATVWGTVSQEISGRVVDSNGNSVAGAQVALCTKDKGVDIQAGQLLPTKWGGKGGEIVKTDAQGRFSFPSAPDEFHLIVAHDQGFAWVTNKERAASGALRLEPWSRLDGTLKIGRELGAGERISLQRGGNRSAADQNIHFDYETYADAGGQFTFEKVPPIWIEVGYLIRVGDAASSYTGRTPIHLLPGQSLKMTLGGEGRPVIGRFVPPAGYEGPIYFGQGLRALDTSRPDLPKPANYDQMTKREQQEWLKQWYKTAEAEAYYDTLWHDLNRRHYTFRIEDDGTFRIEDVIPGQYKSTVWLEERDSGQGRPEEIGAYYGVIEVPAIPGGRTDEPLDLGNLTLAMHNPALHVGDMAPLFEAKTLDGKDIRLADYRGKFVLLSFWQPVSHPELDRLRELHKTYGGAGKLAIIDLGGWDTLEEVRKYVAEHQIEWPEIYFGPSNKEGIANQYGLPGVPYILLVDPQGKIVATWLRTEKLMQAVKDAIGQAK